jgi:DNA-binding response OmpR family regulator
MPAMCGTTAAAIELGADAVLAKPFAVKSFIDAVRALTGSRGPGVHDAIDEGRR